MIALLAIVVATAEKPSTHDVALVPAFRVDERRIFGRALLPLPFRPYGQRGKRAADTVALVSTARPERGASPLAQDVGLGPGLATSASARLCLLF